MVAGANAHDKTLLAATLDAIVVERPESTAEAPQHLCADKGYDYPDSRQEVVDRDYQAHIRSRGEERQARQDNPAYHPRRWVVEVCHAWLNRFRKLLVRFEKQVATYLGLLQFACAYIVFKRARLFR